MSTVSDKFNKTMTNQMYVNSLAEDGVICNYTRKTYDEQQTFKGGQGPRQIFQNLNKKVKLYHKFLKYLLGEERVDLEEAIPVIDYFNPDNSSFLYTYPVYKDQVDSTEIIPTPTENIINYAMAGEQAAEYFYNTRSSVSSQFNIQAGYIDERSWTYEGYITTYNIINGKPSYNLRALPLQFYACDEADEVKIGLNYLNYDDFTSEADDNPHKGKKTLLVPFNDLSNRFQTGILKGGLQRFRGISDTSKSSSVIMLTAPAYYYGLPVTAGHTADSLGSVEQGFTWNSVTLSAGDFVLLLPGDYTDFLIKHRILIFKNLGQIQDDAEVLRFPTDWGRVDEHIPESPTQIIYGKDKFMLGNYLVFMAYLQDIQADIPWETLEVGQIVPESVKNLLNQSPYLFSDILHFERALFGPASGIMNGLFSTPYEYDKTVSESQAAINFGNDELKYPRVIKWRYNNDVDTASFRGMTIASGTKYFPGHLLNRGTMLASPLKRSSKDPVAKLLYKGSIKAFKYADDKYKIDSAKNPRLNPEGIVKEFYEYQPDPSRPNYWVSPLPETLSVSSLVIRLKADIAAAIEQGLDYQEIPYLGKSEIIHDMLNSFDLSKALYSKFEAFYSTSPKSTRPTYLTSQGLVTFEDFPETAVSKDSNMLYPKRLFITSDQVQWDTTTVEGLSHQIEALSAQLQSNQIVSSTRNTVTTTTQTGSITYVSRYTARDIKAYIDMFFDCLQPDPDNDDKKRIYLDYRNPTDLGLYDASEEYGEYQRLTSEFKTEYYKGSKKVDEGTKGATPVKVPVTEQIAGYTVYLPGNKAIDLAENGAKSFHLTYHHQYISEGSGLAPEKPAVSRLTSQGRRIETVYVNGIEYDNEGNKVDEDESAIAFGLDPILKVITPMDTFSKKRKAGASKPDQLLVYPASKTVFPESLFLFSTTDLEQATGKPGAPSILYQNRIVPVILFHPQSEQFLFLQAVKAWHYNYNDIRSIEFYTPETDDFKLIRKNSIIWYQEQLEQVQDRLWDEQQRFRYRPQYDEIAFKYYKQYYYEQDDEGNSYLDREVMHFVITNPTRSGETWRLEFDSDSPEYEILNKLLGIGQISLKNVQSFLRNWQLIATIDEEDLGDLFDSDSEFSTLLYNILYWAQWKQRVQDLENEVTYYENKIADIKKVLKGNKYENTDFIEEFYCYQLQPVPLTLDLAKSITLYKQELSGVDSTTLDDPMEFTGMGDQLQFEFGPISSNNSYFKLGAWNPELKVYDRPLDNTAALNSDFEKLATSEILFRIPDLNAHDALWYQTFSTDSFYKAFGDFIENSLKDPDSPLRQATNQLTQNILSQFQLSVIDSGAMQTPLMLTELPQVLYALQMLKGPLSGLALTGTKIPISALSTRSYSPDSMANLGDLEQLVLRYDNDLDYTALDPFPAESDYSIPFSWEDLTFKSLGDNQYQYNYTIDSKTLGQAQTQLADSEGSDPFQELRIICQSTSLAANHINLAAGLNWIKSEAETENPDSEYVRLVKNLNKLIHCVFKAWIIPQLTLKVTDAVTRTTKKQRSFKYLEQNFATALADASFNRFTQDLCRRLDEQFGDNTRPFLNMEKTSCSLPVDPTVEALKQTYINRIGKASEALIASLQTAASATDPSELNIIWNNYFESSTEDWRSDQNLVSIKDLTSEFKVNFCSEQVQALINKLLKVGYSNAKHNHIVYTPLPALKSLITAVRPLDFTGAYDENGHLILPKTLAEYTTLNHTDPDSSPYFAYASTQTLAAYFETWQTGGLMPEELKTLIDSFNITTGAGTSSKEALLENIKELYQILRSLVIPATYNDIIIEGNLTPELATTALTEYLARETFSSPKTFEFYEEMNIKDEKTEEVYLKSSSGEYQGPVFKRVGDDYTLVTADDRGIPVFILDNDSAEYTQIRDNLSSAEPRYKKRWGWYEPSATGENLNNFYFLPVYCEDAASQTRVSPAQYTKYNAVFHNYYAITLNLHLPDFQYDLNEKKYILKAPDLDLTGIQTDQDQDPDHQLPEGYILPTYVQPADESAIFQATLPVPNASNSDVSEVLLKAIADLANTALLGAERTSADDVAVTMLESDTDPSGRPETLYYKRYEALNNRLNRITGSLYSAARALQGKKQLDKISTTENTALSVYSNLMTVIPIAQFDAMTYMAGQTATASTIPLAGRFYYDAEMESLRSQISNKCVLTCHSCPVKGTCPFYNEEEILKYYCPPAGWLSFYFKDNKLDLLYYDDNPKYQSPDIYEYEETETGKKQIGDSIPAEYFKAVHKPYSEVIRRNEKDKEDWIAPVRPLRKTPAETEDPSLYSLMPLEEELKLSPRLNWNEEIDGDISWLTNARYGTIEVNSNAPSLNNQYQELDLRPYTYLHNAVYVFDEETEFSYRPSPDFYNINDLYLTDTSGTEHRYGGRTRIWLPSTLKAFAEASPGDDVYLVSDDTMDSNRQPLVPIVYLDTIENLRKAGRTAFNLNTNADEGIELMSDKTQYASDIARWSVAVCKNHNANWPADPNAPLSQTSHHSLAENQDQYWMEELTKKVYVDPQKYTGWIAGEDIINGQHKSYTYITVPGRPRIASGYAEPLIDPDNPDESAILSGKPVVANYINFIRQFSIKLCSYDPEHPDDQTKVVWYIKWIKDLPTKPEDWTAKQIKAVEEKKRTLALMKTNLRLVIIKN